MSPNCTICGTLETMQHFFIECNCISSFWTHILNILVHCGVSKPLNNIKYLILGYKTDFKECNLLNVLLSYIGFSIYKGYYISERRSKHFDISKLLRSELLVLTKYYKNIRYHANYFWIFLNNYKSLHCRQKRIHAYLELFGTDLQVLFILPNAQ